MIERAVITSTNDRLNLDRAMPEASFPGPSFEHNTVPSPGRIRTAKELEELERANILQALAVAHWKVSGEQGAAKLLGINASTLSSRMKALKIQKPSDR